MNKLSERGQGLAVILLAIAIITIIAIFGSELLAWLWVLLFDTGTGVLG